MTEQANINVTLNIPEIRISPETGQGILYQATLGIYGTIETDGSGVALRPMNVSIPAYTHQMFDMSKGMPVLALILGTTRTGVKDLKDLIYKKVCKLNDEQLVLMNEQMAGGEAFVALTDAVSQFNTMASEKFKYDQSTKDEMNRAFRAIDKSIDSFSVENRWVTLNGQIVIEPCSYHEILREYSGNEVQNIEVPFLVAK